jgi:hypothetical protein
MTKSSQRHEDRALSEAELDAVNGGTVAITDQWVALRQELSAAYARSNPDESGYHWGHF